RCSGAQAARSRQVRGQEEPCRAQSRPGGFGEAATPAEAEGRAHVAAGDRGRVGCARLRERERSSVCCSVCQVDAGLRTPAASTTLADYLMNASVTGFLMKP